MPDAPAPPSPDTLAPLPLSPLAVEIASGRCAACDAERSGAFCASCGERAPTPEDESLLAFVRDQFHEVTSADGRLWRTLRAMLVPGKLTTEFFAGRRGLYVRPVRLFLVFNVLFFLWMSFLGGQAFLGDAALYRLNPAFSWPMTDAAWNAGVSGKTYDIAFGQQAKTLAPTLIAVFVPLYAVFLGLVLLPVRQSAVRHVVFATHFVAVFMATSILSTVLLGLPNWVWSAITDSSLYGTGDAVTVPLMVAMWIAYLTVALRRVYNLPWWGAGGVGVLTATLGTLVCMELYRRVLFYVTLWTVDLPA